MSMIKCDGNCYECPYPDVPAKCLARPIEPWEAEFMMIAHGKGSDRSDYYRDYDKKRRAAKWHLEEQACISEVRKARGMKQKELAAAVGVKPNTLCCWENGVNLANWDKLCAVLPELEEYRPKGGKK